MRWLWLPLFAAGLRAAALPGWWAGGLAVLAVVPRIAWWERAGSGRRRFLGDWLGGTLFWVLAFSFLANTFWAMPFGPAPILGLWWAAEGALYSRLRRRVPTTLAAVLAITLVEYLRARWPMGGVPWASWGLGLDGFPGALRAAEVVGEGGVSLLALLAGAFLVALFRRQSRAELLVFPAAVALVAGAGLFRREAVALEPIDTLSIQPSIEVDQKSLRGGSQGIFETHLRLGEAAVAADAVLPELLVWAETMFLFPVIADDSEGEVHLPRRSGPPATYPAGMILDWQAQGARDAGAILAPHGWFLTGAHFYGALPEGSPGPDLSPRSSETLAFRPDGSLYTQSRKTELVPFGERLPFGGRFPGARAIADAIYRVFGLHPSFQAGDGVSPLQLPRADGEPMRLGTAICWENVFESVFRRQAGAGAEAFLVLSNEAWFGTRAEMDQMVAATRFRAAESGRAVLRSTNTGVTQLVAGGGEVLAGLPRGQEGVFRAPLPRVSAGHRTLYLAGGWRLVPLAALLAALALALPRRKHNPPQTRSSA